MLLSGDIIPQAGDLVLARIVQIGQHKKIELISGRRAQLHIDDEIVVVYGARYAPDQFEAYVPGDLGPCDLVAAGGVASECTSRHSRMKNPTQIQPLGLLADAHGERINLSDWSITRPPVEEKKPKLFAVVGTMMNAGKTTCAANLVRGFKQKGLRVGAAKTTGTGSGGDRWALMDAGADIVLDFTDSGEVSTFGLSPNRVEQIFIDLTRHLAKHSVDVIVIEVADGLYQRETSALLRSEIFRSRCDGVFFAAGDALGAVAGAQQLATLGHNVLAVSGLMTASPMAILEAKQVLSVPIIKSGDLATAACLPQFPTTDEAYAGRSAGETCSHQTNGSVAKLLMPVLDRAPTLAG